MVTPKTDGSAGSAEDHPEADVLEFAWRVHSAQEAWTAKVDVKASILLALVGGAIFAVASSNGENGLFSELSEGWRAAEIGGVGLMLGALVLSGAAVFPMLGRTQALREQRVDHVIYFGHLRHWDVDELSRFLARLSVQEQIDMLSRQLIAMSSRNWRKHRLLQASLALAGVGLGFVVAAALAS